MKTLLKNEFLKCMRLGGKAGKKKAKIGSFAGYLLVMGIIGVLFAAMFFAMFYSMFAEFRGSGISWTGFSYAVIFSVLFSVVGSVFMSQSQLYRAKDNDLLLSLPIPPWQILFCRLLPLYAQNFYFCFIILFPAYIAYGVIGGVTFLSVLFFLIALLLIPLFSLTLCCLLGLVVALIAARVKHANIISVILSLMFLVAYFAVYSLFSNIMNTLIQNGEKVASGVKSFAYPLYLAGRMFEGDPVGAIVTLAICGGLFSVLYLLLSKTYIGIITRKHAQTKSVYREKKLKRNSVWSVLIGKERKRFFRSTAYLLNCGLGVFILFVAAIALSVFGTSLLNTVRESLPELGSVLAPAACVAICMISAMDGITAPSVSLEGKSIYVLKSFPVEGWKHLFAKVFFQVIFNAPMAVVCGIVAAIVFKASAIAFVMLIIMPVSVNFLFGALGLIFNLKKPRLDWENETTVIKQSISALFLVLADMVIFGVMFVLLFAARLIMSADIYLIICLLLISIGAAGALLWLKKRGAEIWEEL